MYKVRYHMDNNYEVYEAAWNNWDECYEDTTHFVGKLSDCEAWIRLKEAGRL